MCEAFTNVSTSPAIAHWKIMISDKWNKLLSKRIYVWVLGDKPCDVGICDVWAACLAHIAFGDSLQMSYANVALCPPLLGKKTIFELRWHVQWAATAKFCMLYTCHSTGFLVEPIQHPLPFWLYESTSHRCKPNSALHCTLMICRYTFLHFPHGAAVHSSSAFLHDAL